MLQLESSPASGRWRCAPPRRGRRRASRRCAPPRRTRRRAPAATAWSRRRRRRPGRWPGASGRLVADDEHGAAGVGDDLHRDGADAGPAEHPVAHRARRRRGPRCGRRRRGPGWRSRRAMPVVTVERRVDGVGARRRRRRRRRRVCVVDTRPSRRSAAPKPSIGRSGAKACSTWSGQPRALATWAARVTAAMDSGDPSTPTTTRAWAITASSDRECCRGGGRATGARADVVRRRGDRCSPHLRPWHGPRRRARDAPTPSCPPATRRPPLQAAAGGDARCAQCCSASPSPKTSSTTPLAPMAPFAPVHKVACRRRPRRPTGRSTDAPDGASTTAEPAATPTAELLRCRRRRRSTAGPSGSRR